MEWRIPNPGRGAAWSTVDRMIRFWVPVMTEWLSYTALWATSVVMGSSGIFCLYFSFDQPQQGGSALALLGGATAIVLLTGK